MNKDEGEILSGLDQEKVARLTEELKTMINDNTPFVDWLVANVMELIWEVEDDPRQSRIVAVCDVIKKDATDDLAASMQGQVSKSLDKICNNQDPDSPYFQFCIKKKSRYYRFDRKQHRESLEEEYSDKIHFKKDHPAILSPSTVIVEIDGKEVEIAEEFIRKYYYETDIYDIFYTSGYLVVIFDKEGGLITLGEETPKIRPCKESIIEFAELVRKIYEKQNGPQKNHAKSAFKKSKNKSS